MTTLNEGRHPGEFLLSEANFHRSRDTIILAKGSGKVEPGTVLALITATGKYKPAAATGEDGSETAIAINIYGADTTASDVPVAAITRDSEIKVVSLVYGATLDDDTKKLAACTQLAAVGIISR